ncbi:MAG: PTS-dependent dihydroxyacetone kinase phosphotransferase subunit DhaM, partial [Saccharothrix sp.]|nr:PTS-dependent dihydroxyacetone kinase phosphotransferase subunit DhaM [Saccharothrix sp.]
MIGLVVVSHSRQLATGVAELAGQMAPSVAIVPSGGDKSGGLGTDYVEVGEAITKADSGSGVVVLYDLGSAKMVADMAAEEAEGSVVVVDAPLVEGAVAAAVRAQGGAGLA